MSSSSSGSPTGRIKSTRVRTAKGRKISSTLWLQRQLNDPYVAEAKKRGFRSRAAFKLLEMDDKLHLLKPGQRVVDLGAAPGGWTQVAVERVKSKEGKGYVLGMDILEIQPIAGATLLQGDFLADDAPQRLFDALGGQADVVISDLAAPTTGHRQTDHLRTLMLAEMAYDFASRVLVKDGAFLAKLFQGGETKELLDILKRDFKTIKHIKPPASRADSVEVYVVALGFRGARPKDGDDNMSQSIEE